MTYESDVQTAEVNLRAAKIQLLRLLNDQTTPVEQFDVTGPFDFTPRRGDARRPPAASLSTHGRISQAAMQAIDKAKTDHRLAVANGSTDPTISVDAGFRR